MNDDEDRPDVMFCRGCGYSLKGLSENRCPECGGSFDPADARTFRTATKSRQTSYIIRPLIASVCVIAVTTTVIWTMQTFTSSGWFGFRGIVILGVSLFMGAFILFRVMEYRPLEFLIALGEIEIAAVVFLVLMYQGLHPGLLGILQESVCLTLIITTPFSGGTLLSTRVRHRTAGLTPRPRPR